jgi:hypothetical protein
MTKKQQNAKKKKLCGNHPKQPHQHLENQQLETIVELKTTQNEHDANLPTHQKNNDFYYTQVAGEADKGAQIRPVRI